MAAAEPVTLRALADAAGTSTMAIYTHFGGMPGLWSAVREEGFRRLSARLARLRPTADSVQVVAATGAAYVGHALREPHLYRTKFDQRYVLSDALTVEAMVDLVPEMVVAAGVGFGDDRAAAAASVAAGWLTLARAERLTARPWSGGQAGDSLPWHPGAAGASPC